MNLDTIIKNGQWDLNVIAGIKSANRGNVLTKFNDDLILLKVNYSWPHISTETSRIQTAALGGCIEQVLHKGAWPTKCQIYDCEQVIAYKISETIYDMYICAQCKESINTISRADGIAYTQDKAYMGNFGLCITKTLIPAHVHWWPKLANMPITQGRGCYICDAGKDQICPRCRQVSFNTYTYTCGRALWFLRNIFPAELLDVVQEILNICMRFYN